MYLASVPRVRFVRRHLPGGAAAGEFVVGEVDVDGVLFGVDGDLVAVADQGDGAAFLGFGGDVADDEAVASRRRSGRR